MPSFFFHIAFDLDTAPASKGLQNPHEESIVITRGFIRDPPNPKSEERSPGSGRSAIPGSTTSPRLSHDWRYDSISVQNFNMAPSPLDKGGGDGSGYIINRNSTGLGGLATKGRYEPLDPQQEELGWGVVRLYRDAEETPGLYDKPESHNNSKHGRHNSKGIHETEVPFRDEDCTTLCILAVPSYLTPSDFLGFVGEKTRDEVSHFKMIRTERGNRYLVLMKFRNGRKAREWRREWNGKPFDGMEVSFFAFAVTTLKLIWSSLARELPCRLCQVHRISQARASWSGSVIPGYDE